MGTVLGLFFLSSIIALLTYLFCGECWNRFCCSRCKKEIIRDEELEEIPADISRSMATIKFKR
jgi:hypothetical protein